MSTGDTAINPPEQESWVRDSPRIIETPVGRWLSRLVYPGWLCESFPAIFKAIALLARAAITYCDYELTTCAAYQLQLVETIFRCLPPIDPLADCRNGVKGRKVQKSTSPWMAHETDGRRN